MRARAKDTFEDATLNLAPMIDVVFLLLVFFMVATTFAQREEEIPIELPDALTGESTETEVDELVITVERDGAVSLNGQAYTIDTLTDALEAAAAANPDVEVTVRGDRGVVWEAVTEVFDTCRYVGLVQVGIATDPQ